MLFLIEKENSFRFVEQTSDNLKSGQARELVMCSLPPFLSDMKVGRRTEIEMLSLE